MCESDDPSAARERLASLLPQVDSVLALARDATTLFCAECQADRGTPS